jgi:ComF family protein
MALIQSSSLSLDLNNYDMLVPVPLHRNRLRERGYNQSLLLAREIGRRFGVPIDQNMLRRIRDSVPQIELTGTKRVKNVRGVFSLGGDPTGKRLLLVDDVLTTGATANECAGVLRRGGANRVDVFTIARVV